MAKYFTNSKLMYFQEPEAVKIKPKSEISCHITQMSISCLFYARYLYEVVCIRVGNSWYKVDCETLRGST